MITLLASLRSPILTPIRLLNTSVHETGHVVAVALTGGEVIRSHIGLNANSFVQSQGGAETLILGSGYSSVFCWAALLLFAFRRSPSNGYPAALFGSGCLFAGIAIPSLSSVVLPWFVVIVGAAALLNRQGFCFIGTCLAYGLIATGLLGLYGDLGAGVDTDAHQLGQRIGLSATQVTAIWGIGAAALFLFAYGAATPHRSPRRS
jgi:hypothetical protein